MKVFINKLKKTNKVLLGLFTASLIIYLVSYIIFVINLAHLGDIETIIRVIAIMFFGIWFLAWLISGLMSLITKKYKAYVIMIVFTTLFVIAFNFASYYIGTLYSSISEMSKEMVTYTSNLITLKDKEFKDDSTIGMINDTNDIEGYVLGNELIKEYNLKNEVKQYDDYFEMIHDLYEKKIDSAIVSGNYIITFSSEEEFENIESETKIVKTLSKEMENKDNVSYTNKKLTEPFTVLLMGVDSNVDGLNANQAFNGDTLMLITFNPKTLTASAFSIPRDTYVPIACRNNAYAKINSSTVGGTTCVINTIKQLTDIDIDFYVKINFKGVVDLVNAIGGVTVDVEKPYFRYNNGVDYKGKVCEQDSSRQFDEHMVCMDPGVQRLNGEQALAYSRNRHQYIGSDLDRVKHQQQVVSALAGEIKNVTSFEQFQEILKAVEKNIDTNMKNDQILSLYNVAKKIVFTAMEGNSDPVSIKKTYLETYSLPVWLGYSTTSALGYYKSSMDDISKMMKVNLELEKETMTTTYEIDYNEDYTSKFYGQGLRTNPVEKTMVSLIGKSKEEATSWATSNGLTPNIQYVKPGEQGYNASYDNGIVGDQSIHVDTLINNINSVTLYVNEGATNTYNIEPQINTNTENSQTNNTTPATINEENELPNNETNNTSSNTQTNSSTSNETNNNSSPANNTQNTNSED